MDHSNFNACDDDCRFESASCFSLPNEQTRGPKKGILKHQTNSLEPNSNECPPTSNRKLSLTNKPQNELATSMIGQHQLGSNSSLSK